ncbi:MAG: DinB family protein [Anaerolineaceae bacterium]|nr:DinB family protein [Anaerolineaceae bacterium]
MTPDIIRTLLDYHYGEQQKVWQDCVLQLDEAQYLQDSGYSHGSIHETLLHVLNGEWTWLERARGDGAASPRSAADLPDRAALAARLAEVEAEVRAFAGGLDEAGLAAPAPYMSAAGERIDNRVWHILLHIANHGLIHRAEIMAMSARMGGPSFDLSLMRWLYKGRY